MGRPFHGDERRGQAVCPECGRPVIAGREALAHLLVDLVSRWNATTRSQLDRRGRLCGGCGYMRQMPRSRVNVRS